MTKILEHGTIEILGIIIGHLLRDSVKIDGVLLETIMDSGRGYIGYWLRFNLFGEVLDCDNAEGMVSLG
jgi:hypothetical protein